MKLNKINIKNFIGICATAFILTAVSVHADFNPPGSAPPLGNVDPPIYSVGSGQTLSGGLSVTSGGFLVTSGGIVSTAASGIAVQGTGPVGVQGNSGGITSVYGEQLGAATSGLNALFGKVISGNDYAGRFEGIVNINALLELSAGAGQGIQFIYQDTGIIWPDNAGVDLFGIYVKSLNSALRLVGHGGGIEFTDKSLNVRLSVSEAGVVNVASGGALQVNSVDVCLSDGTNCQATAPAGSDGWTDDGAVVRLTTAGDNVGIGTTAPGYKLDVSGDSRSTGTIYANANGAKYFQGGDDAALYDINIANTIGVYGVQDSSIVSVKLGSGGGTISGYTGNVGINTVSPGKTLDVTGEIRSSSHIIATNGYGYFDGESVSGELRVGGIYGDLGLYSPSRNIQFDLGSTSYDFEWTALNVAKMILDGATGALILGNDIYLGNNKAVRIDANSDTTLILGNFNGDGGVFTYGGTYDMSLAVEGNVKADGLCIEEDCRTSWAAIEGAQNLLAVLQTGSDASSFSGTTAIGGIVGIGTTNPAAKLQINPANSQEGIRIVSAANYSPLNIRNSPNNADIFRVDQSGILQVGNVPWARLSGFPSACPAGQYASAVGGALTCSAPPGGIGGSGSTSYVPKWTSGSTLGNSILYDTGSRIGIQEASPGYPLHIIDDNTTAIISVDSNQGTKFWSGLRMARQGTEKWFVGVDNTSSDSLLFRRAGTTNDVTISTSGVFAVATNITVAGQNVCRQDGTNCPAAGATPTLQAVTTAGNTTNLSITAAGLTSTVNLALQGSVFDATNATALYLNVYGDAQIRIDSDELTSPGANMFKINNGANATVFSVNEAGDANIAGNLTVQGMFSSGADLAEEFGIQKKLPIGTVLIASGDYYREAAPTNKEYDTRVIGVISEDPAIVLGKGRGPYNEPIAMVGVVKVLVTGYNGDIAKGDLLTTSRMSGYAMRAADPKVGSIIGKALESFSGNQGIIYVVISLQ